MTDWDISWTKERIFIQEKDNQQWTYDLTTEPYCDKCGKSLVGGVFCWDDDRHNNLKSAESAFQMGFYYSNSKLEFQGESDILSQHILKLKDNTRYAEPIGIAMAMTMINNYKEMLNADLLVPVPSYNKISNHATALCETISNHVEKTLEIKLQVHNALKKITNIKLHNLPTRAEREEAVKGMFTSSNEISVEGKNIILVDDLLTTGHTKSECIRILKMHGAHKVWVFVAAGNV